ncbi:MAG: hypothetical protein ACSHW0_18225 [Thalassotalea sp.]
MKYINQTFSKTKLALCLSSALLVSACGGTDQDDGSASNFEQTFSGQAIDGYLARSTVFIDSNNNGTRDAWEAFAFTDNDGYYSYNPLTDTNYCASDASAQEQQYCLVSNVEYGNVVIRIDGGYDVLTGEPFLGQMSRRVNAEVQSEVDNSVISPITSLLTNVDNTSDRTSLLNSLNINEQDLNIDYLNTDGQGTVDTGLLNTALKIHKVVAVLSDRLTDTYTEIGEDFGTPNDASSAVYPNLAQQIINSGSHLDQALSDQSVLLSALDDAEGALREVYERKEFELPEDMGSVATPNAFTRVAEIGSQISSVVDNLINVNNTSFDLNDAIGGSRALETLVIKTVNEGNNQDNSIENVINFFNPENNNGDLVEELLRNLALETGDLNSLVRNDFTGDDFDSIEDISQASSLPTNSQPFTAIGGLSLKVSDLDLGFAPNNLDDSEVEFYFNGIESAISGDFLACVKHINDANVNGKLGEGSTRGELVDGYWSLLGSAEGNIKSYSLLITLNFLGTTYQAILKPAGKETINNTEYQLIRFDNDGELKNFHSLVGLTEIGSIPSSNAECEARLPSRHSALNR